MHHVLYFDFIEDKNKSYLKDSLLHITYKHIISLKHTMAKTKDEIQTVHSEK